MALLVMLQDLYRIPIRPVQRRRHPKRAKRGAYTPPIITQNLRSWLASVTLVKASYRDYLFPPAVTHILYMKCNFQTRRCSD